MIDDDDEDEDEDDNDNEDEAEANLAAYDEPLISTPGLSNQQENECSDLTETIDKLTVRKNPQPKITSFFGKK